TVGIPLASMVFFWLWQGLSFFGAALTLGIAAALGIYVVIIALVALIHRLRTNEGFLPAPHPHNVLLISLFAAIMAHFVEINFGIAIASTRTTFWTYAALLVITGMNRITEDPPTDRVIAETIRHKSRKKGYEKSRTPPAKAYFPSWLGVTIAVALIGGFTLSTLAYNLVTNADRLDKPFPIIWHALTTLPNRNANTCTAVWDPLGGVCRSGGALMIVGITWLMSAVVFISQQAKSGAFRQHKGDGFLATAIYLLTSLTVGLSFALVLTSHQAAMLKGQPATMADVISLADAVSRFLTVYYWLIIFVLVTGGIALAAKDLRSTRSGAHPWGIIASIVLAILAGVMVVNTNMHPIQADMIYKQADPYEKQNQWLVAIEHYKHAIDLVPREDFYYLYLGRAYLEYAARLDDPAVQEAVMRETEQVLLNAREINPLNTDHSANLARMYRRWADMVSDEDARSTFLEQSSQNYEFATSLSPHNTILWNEWAMLYFFGLGDSESYERTIDHSFALDPEFDQTWMMCGDVNRQRGALEDAVICYERALELSPDALQVWIAVGETYRAMEQWDDAIAALERAAELSPGSGNVWRVMADTYIGAQRWNEAISTLEQVAAIEQDAGDLWNIYSILAQLCAQTGRNDEAVLYLDRALESAPEDQQPTLENLRNQLLSTGTLEE
ncbi:MAG: tetratricopeptide repeat protein, partial [Anaerolineae bacterium]|nr:tetratricopeptide repeat protein [Anaerolineae bacterium]